MGYYASKLSSFGAMINKHIFVNDVLGINRDKLLTPIVYFPFIFNSLYK